MAVPLDKFKPVLQAFLEPNNEVRNAAEKALRDLLATSADQLAASLLQVCVGFVVLGRVLYFVWLCGSKLLSVMDIKCYISTKGCVELLCAMQRRSGFVERTKKETSTWNTEAQQIVVRTSVVPFLPFHSFPFVCDVCLCDVCLWHCLSVALSVCCIVTILLFPSESAISRLSDVPDLSIFPTLFYPPVSRVVQALRVAPEAHIRSLAAVLLRDFLLSDQDKLWIKCSDAGRTAIKAQLLEATETEPERSVRRNTADTCADLALNCLQADQPWPEYFPKVYSWVQSASPNVREMGLYSVEMMGMYIAQQASDQLPTVSKLLQTAMMDDACPMEVRVCAVTASVAIITSVTARDTRMTPFHDTLRPILHLLGATTTATDDDPMMKVLSGIISLAENHALFFKPAFMDFVTAATAIASTAPSAAARRTALEIAVGLAEGAPSLARQLGKAHFLTSVLPVVVKMMTEHEEDPGWEGREEVDEDDEDDDGDEVNRVVAQEAMKRLSDAIRFKKFLPALQPHLSGMLGSPDWKARFAGLRALSCIAESFPETGDLRGIATQVVAFAKDPHPKVRHAVAGVYALYAYYKGEAFQSKAHDLAIPALLELLSDPSMRVKAAAAGALENFSDQAPEEILAPYVDAIINGLFKILGDTTTSRSAKDRSISALSAMCGTVPESMHKFYGSIAPVLVGIVQTLDSKEMRMMRGKAMECLGVLGSCVEAAVFAPHALEAMKVSVALMTAGLESDDPLKPHMWAMWMRIADALKADFVPFLPTVMPPLMTAAKGIDMEAAVKAQAGAGAGIGGGAGSSAMGAGGYGFASAIDSDEEEVSDDEGNVITVKTATLQDQALAINLLALIVKAVGAGYAPYVEETAKTVLPLANQKSAAFTDIRAYAMEMLPELVECASKTTGTGDRAALKSLLDQAVKTMLDAFEEEDVGELLTALVTSIGRCIESGCTVFGLTPDTVATASPGIASVALIVEGDVRVPMFDGSQIEGIVTALLQVRQESVQRRSVRAAERKVYAEDYDEDQLEFEMELDWKEDELHYHIVDTWGQIVKSHGPAFVPVFTTHLLELVRATANPACTTNDRKLALFLIDDVLEFGGAPAAPFLEEFGRVMVAFLEDPIPAVAQAAGYGIGAVAKSQATAFPGILDACTMALVKCIQRPDWNADKSTQSVHDNAVCALGKILHCHTARVPDLARLMQLWLSRQPLTADLDESKVCTQIVCARVESGCAALMGRSGEHVPKILNVFASVLVGKKLCTKTLASRIRGALKSLPEAGLHGALASLPASQRSVLDQLLADATLTAGLVKSP